MHDTWNSLGRYMPMEKLLALRPLKSSLGRKRVNTGVVLSILQCAIKHTGVSHCPHASASQKCTPQLLIRASTEPYLTLSTLRPRK